jgi:hypothetical protein
MMENDLDRIQHLYDPPNIAKGPYNFPGLYYISGYDNGANE